MSVRLNAAGLALAGAALVVGAALSLAVGARAIPLEDVWAALTTSADTDARTIVTELRLPRTGLALLVGASLGAAGALMQGVTRNPLADPSILGVNAGAAFAVVIALSAFDVSGIGTLVWFALGGAAATTVLVHALGTSGRDGATPVKLALAGAVLTALLLAMTSAILVFESQTLDEFRYWIVGSLAGRDAQVLQTVAPFVAVGLVIALASGSRLNGLALGDAVARSLGQRVQTTRAVCAVGFVLLAGGAVAAAGPIAFVGLTVPHIARALVGPDYRWIVPYSAVLGAVLLVGADVLGRVIARPVEVEVGILTAALGAPFFMALVRRRRLAEL